MMREEFGTLEKTILYYRKKAGLTQAQLAERLYTKKSDISEIENDKRSMTIPRLLDIADALQVHLAKLFAYIGQTEDDRRKAAYHEVLAELERLEDMELVGMVVQFEQMLERSSYNVSAER